MASDSGFGVFALSTARGNRGRAPELDGHGRELRQRRPHAKSRYGCAACKRHRIKCDEKRPVCGRCESRNLECRFEANASDAEAPGDAQPSCGGTPTGAPTSTPVLAATSDISSSSSSPLHQSVPLMGSPQASLSSLDMTNLQLMHNFEHVTADTLLFGAKLWVKDVLPLALQNNTLMHAILMISASHLHFLLPEEDKYHCSMTGHLDGTLSGFRDMLSRPLEEQNTDVIVACAFLLLHYAWSVPFFSLDGEGGGSVAGLSTEPDRLLAFACGLRSIMDNVHDLPGRSPEIFKAILKPSAVQQFKDWSRTMENPFHFERLFFRRDNFAEPLPDIPCYGGREYGNPVDRLVPILRCVDALSRGEEIAHMMPQIRAYALMWPAKSSKEFQQEVAENKTDALVIMLSFYATTWWLLSERVWWVKHRSKALCEAILKYLGDSMDTEWGENVKFMCDYFGLRSIEGKVSFGQPGDVLARASPRGTSVDAA